MELVVRTPHGVADVAIASHGAAATIHDLIRLVTGQAVPAVADVDGRAVSTELPLARAGLRMGSVIDTAPPARPEPEARVELLQLAGPGAGLVRPLAPGRYRLGPGRRLTADELDTATVELTAIELTVGDDGTVEVRPGYSGPVTIGGRRISEPTSWHGEMLSVGTRVFALESPPRPPPARRLADPDDRGLVAFHRPPRAGDDGPRRLVVDAVRDAVSTRPTLWRHRAGDLTAFTVPFGLAGDPPGPITLDLGAERGIALVGSEEFTTGLARTLLVELATRHGPADLEIAIATHPELLARWDWAKWLPHLRDDGAPRFITNEPQLHELVVRQQTQAVATAGQLSPSRLTVLVADDPSLWTRRESPLVALLSSHPVGLRLLSLAGTADDAPAACTATVHQGPDLTARLVVPDRDVDVDGVVPALTEIRTATTVARHLAPLDDTERPADDGSSRPTQAPASLQDLLAPIPTTVDGLVDRWKQGPSDVPELPVGNDGDGRLAAELLPGRNVLVTGSRLDVADELATAGVCALAAQLPPDALSIVHVASSGAHGLDLVDALPHFAGRFADPGASASTRLILRLATVVGGFDPTDHRVVVVIDDGARTAITSPGLIDGLVELTEALPALHVVVATGDRNGMLEHHRGFEVEIFVDDAAGHQRGSMRIDRERRHVGFAPYLPPERVPDRLGLVVHPAAYGRRLTALERRLDLLARRTSSAGESTELERLATVLSEAAARLDARPPASLVPPPLPAHHRTETLFADRPGDAVPLGLVDVPERGDTTPLWWRPGPDGSLLLFGSPRAGTDAAISNILLGVPARFSADDLHIYAIDPVARRRAAAGFLPHTGLATAPDRSDEVIGLLRWLAGECDRRLDGGLDAARDDPDLLLLVHDLGQLRRSIGDDAPLSDWLETIAAAAAVGVNVVATAWRVAEAGSLVDRVADRLVGAMADEDDYGRLGVIDPAALEGTLGRCWSTAAERVVQLATPPATWATEPDEPADDGGLLRPPVRPPLPDQAARS